MRRRHNSKNNKFFSINDKYFIPILFLLAFLEPTFLGELFLIIYLIPKAISLKNKKRGRYVKR